MFPSVGVVFASSGGNKITRAVRSFHSMEPDLDTHIALDVSSNTYRQNAESFTGLGELRTFTNAAHINGILNHAIRWMGELGHTHALLFHDDLVFSPLPEHLHNFSQWFSFVNDRPNSGLSFCHFETHTADTDHKRAPEKWDQIDLEDESLWKYLCRFHREDGSRIDPPGRDFWFIYEGCDIPRKWNRLGPSASLVPIATWKQLGGFDEQEGIFYDGEYPSECYRQGLPPVYAIPSFPHIHLHNQTMREGGDPARGIWADTMGAYTKRYGADWPGFWRDDWEQKWIGDGIGHGAGR